MSDPTSERTAAYVSLGSTDAPSAGAISTVVDGSRGASAPPDAAGTAFGDYDIVATIAHGGMGVVRKARDRKLNRVVALKMILPGRLANDEAVRRFRIEAEAAARLDHPGIVPVYEAGERDGRHYIAMAFVEGGSLAARVKEGPFPPRDAAELVRHLAEAIAYAHSRGVIHRDLKPGNVLIAPGGTPKITDFGLAKVLTEGSIEQTEAGQIMGTPAYMPPEQAAGRAAQAGPEADVYALGAILYCLLTGRPPFQAATPVEILRQVLEIDPAPPRLLDPGVPRDLETIALKCLQKDPARRYASAAALADDLRRFLDGRPIIARPAGPLERGTKWVRRNPLAAALIVALTLGLIGSIGGAAVAFRQRDRALQAERDRNSEEQQRLETQRQRLIDTHLASARLALQRGSWPDALAAYDRAEVDGTTLTVAMRLDKVRSWISFGQIAPAQRTLNELANLPDLGEQAPLVDLFRGDLILGIDNTEAERLLNRALAGRLAPGDAWYARGLLARRTDAALANFRKAIEADRFHRDARSFVTFILMILGRHDEALDEAERAELLFPDDAQFQLLLALCQDLRSQTKLAERHWQRLAGVIPDDDIKLLRSVLGLLPKLGPLLEYSSGLRDGSDPMPTFQAMMAFNQLRNAAGRMGALTTPVQNDEGIITKAPILRMPLALQPLHQFLAHMAAAMGPDPRQRELAAAMINDEQKLRDFARLVDDVGDGLSRYWYAVMLLDRALAVSWREKEELFMTRMREAAEAFDRARKLPGFIDARIPAWHGYVLAASHMGIPKLKKPDLDMRRRAAQEVRELMRRGPLPNSLRSTYAKTARQAGDWNLAREILDEWDRVRPNDPEAARYRALVDLEAGSYSSAITAARACLKLLPADAEAKRLLDEATTKLKQQFPDLAKAP